MKALKNLSLVVLAVLFAAATSFAAVKPGKKLAYSVHALKDSQKLMLSIQNDSEDAVEIEILNEAHKVVFKETQRNAKELSKVYNMEGMGEGTYYVHLKSGEFESETPVYVGAHESAIYPFEALVTPQGNNKVHLSFSNAFTDVALSVADAQGNILYSETMTKQYANQIYNLESLAPGIYYINIVCGNKSFKQSYAVE